MPHPTFATPKRPAFTLVEILTVIVIIGILAGIAIPAITGALRTAREAAVRTEIDVVGQALEAYKLKYGDYPPDFSDWAKVERHFRKAFPNIDDSELRLLAQFTFLNDMYQRVSLTTGNVDPRIGTAFRYYRQSMDPAEALVFCLGGFSSNVKRPFSGEGGPFSPIATPGGTITADYGLVQYNTARDNSFIDFADGLSLVIANDPTGTGLTPSNPAGATSPYTYSSDEYSSTVTVLGMIPLEGSFSSRAPAGTGFEFIRFLLDPFPVYSPNDRTGALVYFNGDDYAKTFVPSTVTGGWMSGTGAADYHQLNIYLNPANDLERGVARPYLTDTLDTNAGGFLWADPGKYQIISAGQDGSYGGSVAAGVGVLAGQVALFPSGRFAIADGTLQVGDKYADPEAIYGAIKPQLDNVTSFSTRTLDSDLP